LGFPANDFQHFEINHEETKELKKEIRACSQRMRRRKWGACNAAIRVVHDNPFLQVASRRSSVWEANITQG